MPINIVKENFERFTLEVIEDRIIFEGDMVDKDLEKILDQFLEKISPQEAESLIFDFKNLYFINSTGISKVIRFIIKCRPQTQITFIIDKTRIWQKKCVKTIRSIDKDRISLIEE